MTEHTETRLALPFTEEPRLSVRTDAVAVRLRPVPEGEAPYLVAENVHPDDVRVETRDSEVEVSATVGRDTFLGFRVPRFHRGFGRDASVTLYVPRGLRAAVSVNAGRIDVDDLGEADLTLRNNVGATRVARTTGRLEARSDVGRIGVEGFNGTLNLRNDVGAIDVDVTGLARGDHSIRTEVGGVRVRLPYGAPVHVATRTDAGRVRNSFPPVPAPVATLSIRTSVGGIVVEPSGSPEDAEARRREREEERMRILTMLERHEISVQEAEDLLASLG